VERNALSVRSRNAHSQGEHSCQLSHSSLMFVSINDYTKSDRGSNLDGRKGEITQRD
jgi:hypothetical protein